MPKLPRNLTDLELCKRLAKFGYKQTRQTGSHIRVTRISDGEEHHVTIGTRSYQDRHTERYFDGYCKSFRYGKKRTTLVVFECNNSNLPT